MKKKTGLSALAEKRMISILNQQSQLVEAWEPFLTEVDSYMQDTRGRSLNIHEQRNVAQVLQNALDESGCRKSKLFEATQEDDINFLGIQLPVIAALLPTLVLNDIAIVQALDRRTASVFYFDVLYGSTKGAVTANDTMISSRTGHARSNTAQRRYAMAIVDGEAIDNTAAGTLEYAPGITLGTIVVKNSAGTIIGQDFDTTSFPSAANGTVTDSSGNTLMVVTAAGAYDSATYNANWPEGSNEDSTITYQYQYDLPTDAYGNYDGVPEVNFTVQQSNITAMDFPIKSKYSVGASIDLLKAHGINLESEVVKYLGNEVGNGLESLAIAA